MVLGLGDEVEVGLGLGRLGLGTGEGPVVGEESGGRIDISREAYTRTTIVERTYLAGLLALYPGNPWRLSVAMHGY